MYRYQAQQECNRLNERSREVSKHSMLNANASDFWNSCVANGNFLISGGSENQRTDMLVRMLENLRKRSNDTVILLTGSDMTEAAVTNAAMARRLGNAVVSSSRYPNYDPLAGLDPTLISQLLMSVAKMRGYGELDKMENYINAFIAIASRYCPPSLSSMLQLDRQYPENQELVRFGEASRVSPAHLRAINAYPVGTGNLRNILTLLSGAFRNITSPQSRRRINLLSGAAGGMLVCVNVHSLHPKIMDLALAAELEQLLASQRRFLLILNDVSLCDVEGLYKQVTNAKNVYSGTWVGICAQNVCSWANAVPQVSNSEEALLQNTQNFVLFHSANESDRDLEGLLKYLGTFQKYEAMLGHRPGLAVFPSLGSNWIVNHVGLSNRVLPQDLRGYGVLLMGHHGRRIDLYRGITI